MISINYYIPSDNKTVSRVLIPIATASSAGAIKLGSDVIQEKSTNSPTSVTGKTYPVQLNNNNQAVVNVPWSNTTYSAATNDTLGLIKLGYTQSNSDYPVKLSLEQNKAYVSVPTAANRSQGTLVVIADQAFERSYCDVNRNYIGIPLYYNKGKLYDEADREILDMPDTFHCVNVYDIVTALKANSSLLETFKKVLGLV